jgi:hypothetical protein
MLGLRPKWGVALRYEGETGRPLGAFLLGATLALGWTPCIGPILGAILTLTAVGGGVGLLLAYILGLAVPFFLVALFADRLKGWFRRAGRLSHYVELFAGVVLILVGVSPSYRLHLCPEHLLPAPHPRVAAEVPLMPPHAGLRQHGGPGGRFPGGLSELAERKGKQSYRLVGACSYAFWAFPSASATTGS